MIDVLNYADDIYTDISRFELDVMFRAGRRDKSDRSELMNTSVDMDRYLDGGLSGGALFNVGDL